MSVRLNHDSRPGITRAALVGVAILLFGPVVAPFTTFDFGYARGQFDPAYLYIDNDLSGTLAQKE